MSAYALGRAQWTFDTSHQKSIALLLTKVTKRIPTLTLRDVSASRYTASQYVVVEWRALPLLNKRGTTLSEQYESLWRCKRWLPLCFKNLSIRSKSFRFRERARTEHNGLSFNIALWAVLICQVSYPSTPTSLTHGREWLSNISQAQYNQTNKKRADESAPNNQILSKHKQKNIECSSLSLWTLDMVGVTGFEPAASWSRTNTPSFFDYFCWLFGAF